ncbi:AAA family ATPase [Marichromatium gracile]|uniref:HTH arsR-type domain-containing protein n=1 Tax=Marichromatium gracile TaxID=1048 RepID=A0ABR5VKI9_MARGR|nr:AAA family ATPase [Marichromatium gracile]KXX65667.1 hypothetical protein AY586_09305 [Marichromatium gracile]
MSGFHSSFTPSLSEPSTLEALFVVRERLAQRLMRNIGESVTTANKHQQLLIGPRGIGKTHLIALLNHRLRADTGLAAQLRIAWLPEDPYITGYTTLLALILRQLRQDETDLAWLEARLDDALDLPTEQQTGALEQRLLECLDGRTLLLIVENLDDLLTALKDAGQKQLRAFIQNHGNTSILATTTSLTEALTERSKTFYGFFREQRLRPFEVDEAATLLARLAEYANDPALADQIWSPLGLARVRALHYLAGGNPRVYTIFHDFLTRDSLDELVTPLMKLLDELTPYYQSRMLQLAPLQRAILDTLRRLRRAAPVKEIARQVMTSSQTISTQLGKLEDLGYVIQADSIGRSNYYELREPLMRLCLEVKEQRGQTIPFFIEFLRIWFSPRELDTLARRASAGELESLHLETAALQAANDEDPLCSIFARSISSHLSRGDHEGALAETECAIQRDPDNPDYWREKARCLALLERPLDEQLACWERVSALDPEDDHGWNQQDVILSQLGRHEAALSASEKALALKPDDPALNHNHALNLQRAGRHTEAREHLQKWMELEGEPQHAADWHQRANILSVFDRQRDALHAYRKTLELAPHRMEAWSNLLGWLQEQGRHRLIHRMCERVAALMPDEARVQTDLGIARYELGDLEGALESGTRALELDGEDERSRLYFAINLVLLGHHTTALERLEQPYPTATWNYRRRLLHADTLMWLDRWGTGIDELDAVLRESPPADWCARGLDIVAWLPLRTQGPHIWRRFISTWLDLFGRHDRLPELGEALVYSAHRFAVDWITDQTARAWVETWHELAGDIEALALPLRLLAASADYKASRDRRILLGLAREERQLLEPWLVNLFKTEPDEIDHEMEALLQTVAHRLAQEAETERSRALWQAPPPPPDTLDPAARLSPRPIDPRHRAARLLPGDWKTLDRTEAEAVLTLLAERSEDGARLLARPELRVIAIERRDLGFSPWRLHQVHVQEGQRIGAIDLLATDDQLTLVDGTSTTIHTLFSAGQLRLTDSTAAEEYARFYCSMLRADAGRFQVVESVETLCAVMDTPLPPLDGFTPWAAEPTDTPDSGRYSGTILYGSALFRATLTLDRTSGTMDMVDDTPVAEELSIRREVFDGPIRWLGDRP